MEKFDSIKRIFDVPYYQLENHPQSDALVSKENGKWVKTSIQEYIEKANLISKGLLKSMVDNRTSVPSVISLVQGSLRKHRPALNSQTAYIARHITVLNTVGSKHGFSRYRRG